MKNRGFTLIEMVITVAIIAILAAVALGFSRWAVRGADLGSASYDLAIRLTGLRSVAMTEGQDYLFVFVDAPGNDASTCGYGVRNLLGGSDSGCARYFLLKIPNNPPPPAPWTLGAFDPSNPGANAALVDEQDLPRNVRLHFAGAPLTPPPNPFQAIPYYSGAATTSCIGGGQCFAIRFRSSGDVSAETPGGGSTALPGYAFALGIQVAGSAADYDQRGILVAFPTGLVKGFSL